MSNPKFYEVTNITTTEEVAAAYKYAVDNNVKYYRAVSKQNNLLYGWDERNTRYIKLDYAVANKPNLVEKIDGAYWFVNEKFVEEGNEVVEDTATEGTPVVLTPAEETPAPAAAPISAPVPEKAPVVDDVDETPYIPDYKTLYERLAEKYQAVRKSVDEAACARQLFESAREALGKKTAEYDSLKTSYLKAREAQHKTLEAVEEMEVTIKDLSDTLEELKDDVNSIKFVNLE